MNFTPRGTNSKLLTNSQSRILVTNNSKINIPKNHASSTDSDSASKVKLSFSRKIDHTKSNSILSNSNINISRITQSYVRQREVDKTTLEQNSYKFIAFQPSQLHKGFKLTISSKGNVISRIRLDNDTIQTQKNQIKHLFDLPKRRQAQIIKVVLSSLSNQNIKIIVESVTGKFKQSSIIIDGIPEDPVQIDPYKMIEQAQELRKRKFSQNTSKSAMKVRPSLKLQDSAKLLKFNKISTSNKLSSLTTSQVSFIKPQQKKNNIQQTPKTKKLLNFKQATKKKIQISKYQTNRRISSNVGQTKSELNISTSSINTQPTIHQISSVKSTVKPQNPYIFKRTQKPITYSELALSKLRYSTSRIQ